MGLLLPDPEVILKTRTFLYYCLVTDGKAVPAFIIKMFPLVRYSPQV